MAAHPNVARARRRVQDDLACLDDTRLADVYEQTLLDPANLDFSPYLVTALVDAKQWDRLDRELTRRKAPA